MDANRPEGNRLEPVRSTYDDTPRRGRHRIYIGMTPKGAKPYQMLQESEALRADGIDVLIGLLETHGRQETAEQAVGLERLPLRSVMHRDRTLYEDVEVILAAGIDCARPYSKVSLSPVTPRLNPTPANALPQRC
jgi:two-component system sensor histidine kinase KdpD